MDHALARSSFTLLCALCACAASPAGDLNPPAGPVVPTHKTLTEVEPRTPINATTTPGDADSLFRITQPGSYYLTSTITGVAAKHGIEIAASGVSVDLNGFEIAGIAGALDGISATGLLSNISLRDGVVRGWSGIGINLSSVEGTSLSGLVVDQCASDAIVTGARASVTRCRASRNGEDGIVTSTTSIVTDSIAADNAGTGIFLGTHAIGDRLSAYNNTLAGIQAGANAVLTACISRDNGGAGFATLFGSRLDSCEARANDLGFSIGAGNSAHGCVAYANTTNGFELSTDVTLDHCAATSNVETGITAGARAAITACNASNNNAGIGLSGDDCTVLDSIASENDSNGISISADRARISRCTANRNGFGSAAIFSGIIVAGTNVNSTIEGCTLTANEVGISCSGTGCTIVRNIAKGNTISNYNIAGGNHLGATVANPAAAGPHDNISN